MDENLYPKKRKKMWSSKRIENWDLFDNCWKLLYSYNYNMYSSVGGPIGLVVTVICNT